MEKQDILVVGIAIIAFAVLALLVRPIISGQSLGQAAAGPTPGGGSGAQVVQPIPVTYGTTGPLPPGNGLSATPVPTPTETHPWNGVAKNIGFVGLPEGQVTLAPSPTIPQAEAPNVTFVTYAIISGQWSGTTENVYIPTPYWILNYTAEPLALPPDAYPVLIIQVFDAQDPNRYITAPIDQQIYTDPMGSTWSQMIYEGKRTYYFKIDASFIQSYTINILVPQQYT